MHMYVCMDVSLHTYIHTIVNVCMTPTAKKPSPTKPLLPAVGVNVLSAAIAIDGECCFARTVPFGATHTASRFHR